MKKNIYLVRHAESESNVGMFKPEGKVENIKLTKNGHAQSKNLVKTIKNVRKIYVSKYSRTHETATPLAKKYTNGKFVISKHIHEFTFMNSGFDNSIDKNQISKYVKEFWKKLDPVYKIGKGSESFKEFVERLQNFSKQLKRFPNNTLIFTHKNVILTLLILLKDYPLKIEKKFNKKELSDFMLKLRDSRHDPVENVQVINLKDVI